MKDAELQAFEEKFGYKPTAIPVAIDAHAADDPIPQTMRAYGMQGTPTTLLLCGEANVISINADGVAAPSALAASVARGDISTDYTSGWASWDLGNGAVGVPVVGASFMRAANGAVNYGFAFPHKTTRPVAP